MDCEHLRAVLEHKAGKVTGRWLSYIFNYSTV